MEINALLAVFVALFVGHSVADHWVQTSCQAVEKAYGAPGTSRELRRRGQLACLRHVLTLTATKWLLVLVVVVPFHVKLNWWQALAGLTLDAVSHYWADRRWTLEELARYVGKGEFYDQGTDLVDCAGEKRPHIGTGRYALDQSWHHLWLLIGAWIATVPLP
ncbi:hypothetical protein HOU95_gp065 [Streptomyces phage Hiyaa]|uniref:DUF3307 domain-containing protein n=1 Tax=Streptomyces phage Hiyaa TaxID=2499072 RepID=A0A3S9U8U4_9CAUD|nr:hypothetical protein HOU95_gp065 [Streptomyces phage Hiyaa]AZS06742.1 hypothetical protein SEA_HIYAA_103 [Streptomyces phage Hiyaa]